jgi:hypothetical protein
MITKQNTIICDECGLFCSSAAKANVEKLLAQANNETTDKLMKAFNLTVGDLPAFPKKDTNLIDLIICIGLAKAKKEAYGQGREDFAVELLKAGAIGEGLKDIINQLK